MYMCLCPIGMAANDEPLWCALKHPRTLDMCGSIAATPWFLRQLAHTRSTDPPETAEKEKKGEEDRWEAIGAIPCEMIRKERQTVRRA